MTTVVGKTLILVVLGVIVVVVGVVYARRALQPRSYELRSATITKLDFEQRDGRIVSALGELSFVHPKSGQTMTVTGRIPADCPIYVGDATGGLADLQVGEAVAVRGTVSWDRSIQPLWVRVVRPPTTAPASAPRPAPGGP